MSGKGCAEKVSTTVLIFGKCRFKFFFKFLFLESELWVAPSVICSNINFKLVNTDRFDAAEQCSVISVDDLLDEAKRSLAWSY